jgi:hypothetical protein
MQGGVRAEWNGNGFFPTQRIRRDRHSPRFRKACELGVPAARRRCVVSLAVAVQTLPSKSALVEVVYPDGCRRQGDDATRLTRPEASPKPPQALLAFRWLDRAVSDHESIPRWARGGEVRQRSHQQSHDSARFTTCSESNGDIRCPVDRHVDSRCRGNEPNPLAEITTARFGNQRMACRIFARHFPDVSSEEPVIDESRERRVSRDFTMPVGELFGRSKRAAKGSGRDHRSLRTRIE